MRRLIRHELSDSWPPRLSCRVRAEVRALPALLRAVFGERWVAGPWAVGKPLELPGQVKSSGV